jgi:hypothetical protein
MPLTYYQIRHDHGGIQYDLGGLRGLGHGLNLEFSLRTIFTHHIIER